METCRNARRRALFVSFRGQRDTEARAVFGRAGGNDLATVAFHDRARDPQTEAEATGLGIDTRRPAAIEACEDVRFGPARHAGPLVLDPRSDRAPGRCRADTDRAAFRRELVR